jgi:hypothetical protein
MLRTYVAHPIFDFRVCSVKLTPRTVLLWILNCFAMSCVPCAAVSGIKKPRLVTLATSTAEQSTLLCDYLRAGTLCPCDTCTSLLRKIFGEDWSGRPLVKFLCSLCRPNILSLFTQSIQDIWFRSVSSNRQRPFPSHIVSVHIHTCSLEYSLRHCKYTAFVRFVTVRFVAYFTYFGKIKVGLCDLHAVCVPPPLSISECLNQSSWNSVCISWHLSPSQRCTS